MALPRHLTKAPIVEAIVDIRTPQNNEITPEFLRELRDSVRDDFPVTQAKVRRQAHIEIVEDGRLKTDVKQLGFHGLFLTSDDGRNVVQFRPDGFTYNRLAPYTSWAEIRSIALPLWERYVSATGPKMALRLAMRYINRLNIPLSAGSDFNKYLVSAPSVPEAMPQLMSDFLVRVVLHDPITKASANVTQSLERAELDRMNVLFDIDVYRQGEFSVTTAELLPVLEDLHTLKNTIFFESLTETTVGFYE